jgi:SAM-dependent methyltransferase
VAKPTDLPLQLAPPEAFARVRDFFRQAAFDDTNLCRVLGLEQISEVGGVDWEKTKLEGISAPLRWCIDLFLRRGQAGERESRDTCGQETWAAFQSLGLVQTTEKHPSAIQCPVWVYPADGFIIASDRPEDPEGRAHGPAPDVVFPAIYPGTLRFLRLLPSVEGGDALDLCGGTGIGALHFSRSARSSVTADITPRAAFFAEFNARLNGSAVESCCGDLYAPLNGRQFDVISAHPPFVPATANSMTYRDGGDSGEDVTRRIIEGLPAHLRPGGACVVLCVARDTQEQTFEQRARGWLGKCQEEFDIVFGLEKILEVDDLMKSLRKGGQFGEDQERELRARLASLATRHFVYGSLALRRYPARLGFQPLRVNLSPEGGAGDFNRLLAWRHFSRGAGFSQWLADARPRFARELELTARHVVRDGELTPAEFVFSIQEGLPAALRPDSWIAPLVARLNGTRSPREVIESARLADELPEGFGLEPFLQLTERMIELGLLEVDFLNR